MDSVLETIKTFTHDQYSNENRLKARMQIYEFCEKKINWREWIFDKLNFSNVSRILELGCGNGMLWKDNNRQMPGNIHVVLSDVSRGMVDAARDNLKEHRRQFDFLIVDACHTAFQDAAFQMIIASHMLYLIQNKVPVFSEIDRILDNDGLGYASTLSSRNTQELVDIVVGFNKELEFDNSRIIQSFKMENGENVLSEHFKVLEKHIYENDVIIDNIDSMIMYVASCYSPEQIEILTENYEDFRRYLESVIQKYGKIRITNKNILFVFGKQ